MKYLELNVPKIFFAQMLMNARRRKPVSALNVAVKIPGGAMTARVVGIFCISGTMTPA